MKLKLPIQYFALTASILCRTRLNNKGNKRNQMNYTNAAFSELRLIFIDVTMKNLEFDADKKVSKKIPDSYGLLFFEAFNGVQIEGYDNVVVKEICRQVEKQLYKSGKYQLEN